MTIPTPSSAASSAWPTLPYAAWQDTYATLHLWTQIVGKIRLLQMPWINHSWHVTLYPTARGLTTLPMPYDQRAFQIDFDFIAHRLVISTSDGAERWIAQRPYAVAEFYGELFAQLADLDIAVQIHTTPNEIVDGIPFDQDYRHASYDGEYAQRFWRVLIQVERVFMQFRAHFLGKCSPVHFFWAASILPSRAFQGAPHRVIPAACRICPTGWRARPIRMNSAAAASGRAAAPSLTRRFMLMPIPNRRATAPRCLPPAVTTSRCGNSCCLTMTYGTPPNPLPCCSNFCNAPMRRPPTWATGIAPRSNAQPRPSQRHGGSSAAHGSMRGLLAIPRRPFKYISHWRARSARQRRREAGRRMRKLHRRSGIDQPACRAVFSALAHHNSWSIIASADLSSGSNSSGRVGACSFTVASYIVEEMLTARRIGAISSSTATARSCSIARAPPALP